MWSVLRAGYDADATLIGESTGLRLAHAGTGVVWARLSARGDAGHAMLASGDGPFDSLCRAVDALRRLEAEINEPARDPVFAAVGARPYGMSIGRIEGGVWTSSTPHELAVSVRFGFGRELDPSEAQARIRAVVAEAAPAVEVAFEAFRARAYCHEPAGPLFDAVAGAHVAVTGTALEPYALTATTDARFVAGPCFCYGPEAGNLHGTDEWVDVETLVRTAETVALTAARWTT